MKLNFQELAKSYIKVHEELPIEEYFQLAKDDEVYYASCYKRLLKAIGEPEIIETDRDPRLSRIFSNRIIKVYKPFKEFFGLEDVVEKIVSYLEHAAQGLEEKKQILYLMGSVGGGKSSIACVLTKIFETQPFYAIKGSPLNESPMGLLRVFPSLQKALNIPEQDIPACVSPWLTKRLDAAGGDISKFKVVKLYPSLHHQLAISKTEPGDENNQDISTLVGKLDIRKLEHYAQDDPDAYKYNGGLCLGNRGILEFVEMFKAPLKVLNPLLTATQEGNYKATEALAALPFDGLILSHSNESEWLAFKNNKQNEAFLDRIYTVKVPYCLRYDEEVDIYQKYITASELRLAPTAPNTLETLAKFSVLSRLDPTPNMDMVCKLKVYNGNQVKDEFPNAKSLHEYKELAPIPEGFSGVSTRAAFKMLSKTYNYDLYEKAANPIHLFSVIDDFIETEDFPKELKNVYQQYLNSFLIPDYLEKLRKDIQIAYLDSYAEYGQHLFDKYIAYADAWIQDQNYRDPDTGQIYDRAALNRFLEEIEKPAGIANPKEFRHEIVTANLRYAARSKGKNISWTQNDRIREVLEKKLFKNIDDILPQISFEKNDKTTTDGKKHANFIKRMVEKGYTERQVKLAVTYFRKASMSKK